MRRSTSGRSVKRRTYIQIRENSVGGGNGTTSGFSDDDKRKLRLQIAKLNKRYYLHQTQQSVSCCELSQAEFNSVSTFSVSVSVNKLKSRCSPKQMRQYYWAAAVAMGRTGTVLDIFIMGNQT